MWQFIQLNYDSYSSFVDDIIFFFLNLIVLIVCSLK